MPECRLCGGALEARFTLRVLHRHDVAYLQCGQCDSLQTETPYWIDEAYASNLADIDTGGARRALFNSAACYLVARSFGLRNVVDFGGGDGLLCRLLRDQHINAFVQDRYAPPTYAQGFTQPDFAVPDLLSAFEVLEHFTQPARDIEQLLAARPRFVLASTQLYRGQGADWWYLAPETGQHVFFYGARALQWIGAHFGYRVCNSGDYLLLVRADEPAAASRRMAFMRWLLRGKVLRLVLMRMALLPGHGAMADQQALRARDRARTP